MNDDIKNEIEDIKEEPDTSIQKPPPKKKRLSWKIKLLIGFFLYFYCWAEATSL